MALDATGRTRAWAAAMRLWKQAGIGAFPSNVTKADLLAAVQATDDWIETNSPSYNSALPQPFRGSASPAQKTWLFCLIAMRRAGLLRVEED